MYFIMSITYEKYWFLFTPRTRSKLIICEDQLITFFTVLQCIKNWKQEEKVCHEGLSC